MKARERGVLRRAHFAFARQMGAKLFCGAALLLPPLLCPLFARAGGAGGEALGADRFGVAALPPDSPAYWAVAAAAYALAACTALLVDREEQSLLWLRLRAAASPSPAPPPPEEFAVLVTDIPIGSRSADGVGAFFGSLYKPLLGDAGAFPLVVMAPHASKAEPAWRERNAAARRAGAAAAAELGLPPAAGSGRETALDAARRRRCIAARADADAALVEAEDRLAAARREAVSSPSAAAFVVFPTRSAAAAAAGALHSADRASSGGRWHVSPCPPASSIAWDALQRSPRGRALRRFAAATAAAVLVASFLFVVAGVASLASLPFLTTLLPGAEVLTAARLQPFIEGYAAVAALLICLFAAPAALTFIAARCGGHVTKGGADADASRAFLWLCFVDVFIGSAAIQEAYRQVVASLADPSGSSFSLRLLTAAVGGSVPTAAPFFMLIALARAGTSLGMALLRLTDVPVVLISSFFATTVAAKRAAWAPPQPPYVSWGPSALFLLFLGLVYAPIAPLVTLPVALYFVVGSLLFKYQLLYVYAPCTRGAGRLWLHLRAGVFDGACVALFVLTAVLGLHRAAGPAAAVLLLLIATLAATHAARQDAATAAFERLPADVAAAADAARGTLSGPPPFPMPESFYPPCMYDDTAADAACGGAPSALQAAEAEEKEAARLLEEEAARAGRARRRGAGQPALSPLGAPNYGATGKQADGAPTEQNDL